MHASGHIYAHVAQPTQFSGFTMYEKLYPFEFASLFRESTSHGHATMHKLHPLQRSVLTTTAPFAFAIIY